MKKENKQQKINVGYAMKLYRVERWLYVHKMFFGARIVFHLISLLFNCSIPYTCVLEEGVIIAHSIGIVIHANTTIGAGSVLYQNITIGNKNGPKIGKRCIIGSGAVILGDVNIGDDVKVGANAVVLEDIPDGSTVVGVPAKVVRRYGQKV